LRTGSLFYSKLILKLVISFMNRKSSCGYATHFFVIKMIQFFEFEMNYYIILFSLLQVVVGTTSSKALQSLFVCSSSTVLIITRSYVF
jgi:hypothetical protein